MSERRSPGETMPQRRARSPSAAEDEGLASPHAKLRKVGTEEAFSRVPGDVTQASLASAATAQAQAEGATPADDAAHRGDKGQGEAAAAAGPPPAALLQATIPPVVIDSEMRFVCLQVRRVTLTPNLAAASLGASNSASLGYEVVVAALTDVPEAEQQSEEGSGGARLRMAWKDVFMLHPDLGPALVESHVLRRGLVFTVAGRRIEVVADTNKLAAAAFEGLKMLEEEAAAGAGAGEEGSSSSRDDRPVAAVTPAPFIVFKLRSRGFLRLIAEAPVSEVEDLIADPMMPWHPACPFAAALARALRTRCEDPLAVGKAAIQHAGPVLCARSLCESMLSESAVNEEPSYKGLHSARAEPLPFLPVAQLRVAGMHDLMAPPPAPDVPVVVLADPHSETLGAAVDCFRPAASASGKSVRRTQTEKMVLQQPALQVPLLGRLMAVSKLFYWAKPTRADRLPLRFSITLADETLAELQVNFWAHDAARYYAAMRVLPLGSIVSIQGYRITEWAGKLEATVHSTGPGPVVALVQPDEAAAFLAASRLPATPLMRLRFTPAAMVLAGAGAAPSADPDPERPPINVCGVVTRVGPWCRAPLGTDPLYEAGTAAGGGEVGGSGAAADSRGLPPVQELAEPGEGAFATGEAMGVGLNPRAAGSVKALYQSSRGVQPQLQLPVGVAAALQSALAAAATAGSDGDELLTRAGEPLQAVAESLQVLERLRPTCGTVGTTPGKGRYLAWRWVWVTDESSATSIAVKLYDGSQSAVIDALAPGAPVALYRVKVVSVPDSKGAKSTYLLSTPQTSVFAGVAGAPFDQQPEVWQHALATDVARVHESVKAHARLPPSVQRPPLSAFAFGLQRLQHWAEAAWAAKMLLPASPTATALPHAALPAPTLGPLPDEALAPVVPVPRPLPAAPSLPPSSLTRPASLGDYISLLARAPLFTALPGASGAALRGVGAAAAWRTVPVLSLRSLKTLLSYGAALRALTAASMSRRGALRVADPVQGEIGFDFEEVFYQQQAWQQIEDGGASSSVGEAATPYEAAADGPLTPSHLQELLAALPTLQPGQLLRLVVLAKVVRIDASLPEEGGEEDGAAGGAAVAARSPAATSFTSPGAASRASPLHPWSTGGSRASASSRRLSLPAFASDAEAGPSQAAERALLAAMSAANRLVSTEEEAASALSSMDDVAAKPAAANRKRGRPSNAAAAAALTSPASTTGGASAPGSLARSGLRSDNPLLASLATEEDVARTLAALAAGEPLSLEEPDTPATAGDDAVTFSVQQRSRLLRRSAGEAAGASRRLSLGSAASGTPASQASSRAGGDPDDGDDGDALGDSAGGALLQRLPLARGGRRRPLRQLSMQQAARALLPPPSRSQALADMHEDAAKEEWAAADAATPLYTLVVAGATDEAEAATLRLPLLPAALLPLSSKSGQVLPVYPRLPAASRAGMRGADGAGEDLGADAPTPPVNGADAATPPVSGADGALAPPPASELQAAADAQATGVDVAFLQSVFPAPPPSHPAASAAAVNATPATSFVSSVLHPDRVFAVCLTVQQQGLDLPAGAAGGGARAGRGQRRPVVRVEAVYDAPPSLPVSQV